MMNAPQIVLLIVAIFLLQAGIWFLMSRWLMKKTEALKKKLIEQYQEANIQLVVAPQSALYRGADAQFGNVRGNGVICLTGKALLFEKITGQKIEIPRAEIAGAGVEKSFRGKTSLATGGRHLVIETRDGNRIGFLLKEAEAWVQEINQ